MFSYSSLLPLPIISQFLQFLQFLMIWPKFLQLQQFLLQSTSITYMLYLGMNPTCWFGFMMTVFVLSIPYIRVGPTSTCCWTFCLLGQIWGWGNCCLCASVTFITIFCLSAKGPVSLCLSTSFLLSYSLFSACLNLSPSHTTALYFLEVILPPSNSF